MIAALDGAPLSLSSGGLRRYTEELALALEAIPDMSVTVMPPRGRLWWSVKLPFELVRLRADIFHGTNFEVPYVPVCPSVLTLHDLSPWKQAEWHHGADRVRRRTPALLRLGLATMVITPSEAVRREAMDRFRLSAARIAAVPEAAADHLRPTGAPAENYFLFVGTLEPRKNIPSLVDAWRELRTRHMVDLVLAGRARADAPPLPDAPGLRVLGEVPESALADLYSRALAVVYPSMYEGFGLPVLEAMQCGAPVITSQDPAILEVSGSAAIHVSGTHELAQAMEAILLHPEEREYRRALSLSRAAQFTWARTASLTKEVYVEAIQRWQF